MKNNNTYPTTLPVLCEIRQGENLMTSELPDFYQANMGLLKKLRPELWQQLKENPIGPKGEVFITESGKPSLRVSTDNRVILFHNDKDPDIDNENYLEYVEKSATGTVTLLGMGLGHVPLAILAQRPSIKHLVIIEPEPQFFLQAMKFVDLEPIIASPKVVLSILPDTPVEDILDVVSHNLQIESAQFLRSTAYFLFNKEKYEDLENRIDSTMNSLHVCGSTVRHRGREFLGTRFRNLTLMPKNNLLDDLEGVLSGVPAILVAGGPSLDQSIKFLHEAQGKAAIFCVDSALPSLLKHGITPDFLAVIDPHNITFEKVAGSIPEMDGKPISLICPSSASDKFSKILPVRRTFWSFSSQPIDRWIDNMLGGKGRCVEVQSVAHMNLYAASIMGASPIIFIGQDLSYTTAEGHASNTVLKQRDFVQQLSESANIMIWMKSLGGGKIQSSRAFLSMLRLFEKIIAASPNLYINSTAVGAHIKGTEEIPFPDAIKQYCTNEINITELIGQAMAEQKLKRSFKIDNIIKELQQKHNKVKKLLELNTRSTKFVNTGMGKVKKWRDGEFCCFDELSEASKVAFRKVDKVNKEMDSKVEIWDLVREDTLQGIRKSEQMLQLMSHKKDKPEKYVSYTRAYLKRIHFLNNFRKDTLTFFLTSINTVLSHLKKEKKFVSKIQIEKKFKNNVLALCQIYSDSMDINLLQSTVKTFGAKIPHCAELNYYRGCVAAYRCEFDTATAYFQKALEEKPTLEAKTTRLRNKLADEYYDHAIFFQDRDRITFRKILCKGLKIDNTHIPTRELLHKTAQSDLNFIAEGKKTEGSQRLLTAWHDDLSSIEALEQALEPTQVSMLYYLYGEQMLMDDNMAEAASALKKAFDFDSSNIDYCVKIIEVLFSMENFSEGIMYLKEAVKLDRSKAKLWENIGDNLQSAGQFHDAVSAYEQCFMAIPENNNLLKKMGDCYLAAGSPIPAQEAYDQFNAGPNS